MRCYCTVIFSNAVWRTNCGWVALNTRKDIWSVLPCHSVNIQWTFVGMQSENSLITKLYWKGTRLVIMSWLSFEFGSYGMSERHEKIGTSTKSQDQSNYAMRCHCATFRMSATKCQKIAIWKQARNLKKKRKCPLKKCDTASANDFSSEFIENKVFIP